MQYTFYDTNYDGRLAACDVRNDFSPHLALKADISFEGLGGTDSTPGYFGGRGGIRDRAHPSEKLVKAPHKYGYSSVTLSHDVTVLPVIDLNEFILRQGRSFAMSVLAIARETPVWPVSKAALKYGPPSLRIQQLALPKPLSSNYEFLRNCYMGVAEPAKRATASERTRRLAQSNPHKVWPSTDGYPDPGFTRAATEVSGAALTASCSPQVLQLAEFRPLDENCRQERPIPIPVSPAALTAQATPRLKKLSRPARSKATTDGGAEEEEEYDEERAYRVSVAAQKCVASRRTVELAVPVRVKGVRVSLAAQST